MDKLKAYVDGSFDSTNQIYGAGCVILNENNEIIEKISFGGNHPALISMRNVTGEIIASLIACHYTITHGYDHIDIYYDYEGIEMWANQRWKRNKPATKKYAETIEEYRKLISINFHKVKAHSNDEMNDEADKLAKKGITNYSPNDSWSQMLLSEKKEYNLFTYMDYRKNVQDVQFPVQYPVRQKPYIFSFEGIDGCGKSTVIRNVYETLKDQGYDVILTKEPAGTKLGEQLKSILLNTDEEYDGITDFLLFAAARRDHYLKVIKPALDKKQIVLCDRFIGSSLIYQGIIKKCPISFINMVHSLCLDEMKNHTSFYLEVPVLTAKLRREKRTDEHNNDKNDMQNESFYMLAKQGFDYIYQAPQSFANIIYQGISNLITVDASKKIEDTTDFIVDKIKRELNK